MDPSVTAEKSNGRSQPDDSGSRDRSPQLRAPSRADYNLSLRDTLNILYRRIYLLKFLVIGLPLGVFVAAYLMTPMYESTAKILVTAKKENATLLNSPKDSGASMYVNMNVEEMDLNSEMELLRSLDLWIRTVKQLGLANHKENSGSVEASFKNLGHRVKSFFISEQPLPKTPPTEDSPAVREKAQALLKEFKVVPAVKSKVLDISFRHSDSVMTQKILATLLDLYIPYHMEVYSLPGAEGFYSGQGDLYREKYEKADQELMSFKKKWGLSLPEKQKSELISTVKQIEDSLVEVNANLSQYSNMMSNLERGFIPTGQLAATMQRGNENTVVNVIISQLIRAEQKQLQAAELFSADSRDNRAAAELVTELRRRLKESIQSEMDIIMAKKVSLEDSLKAKQAELQQLEEKSEEARRLQLTVTIAKERYLQYMSKEEEARLETLKIGKHLVNVSIVAKPFAPTRPVFPNTWMYVVGALLVSFPLGIGLILLVNFFDHTFDTPRDVELATSYKVLASIGKVKKFG